MRVPAGASWGRRSSPSSFADAVLEKFGGDSLRETRSNLERYLEALP